MRAPGGCSSSCTQPCRKPSKIPLIPPPPSKPWSLPTPFPLPNFSGQSGLNWGRFLCLTAPRSLSGCAGAVGILPLAFWPCEPRRGGALANIQHSQTHIFILLYCSSKKTRVCVGRGDYRVSVKYPGGRWGGLAALFFFSLFFCLDYLRRTAGPSSDTCLCDVAPMGAAAPGTAVPSRGVCVPNRHERAWPERNIPVVIIP